jgi:hypothetical protein
VQVTDADGYCLMLVFAACRMSLVRSRESQSLGSSTRVPVVPATPPSPEDQEMERALERIKIWDVIPLRRVGSVKTSCG